MLIRYLGPSRAAVIAATGQTVPRGDTVDVPDDLGARLVAQAAWSTATSDPDPAPDTEPPSTGRRRRTTSTEEN